MKIFKRSIALVMVISLIVLSFAACGSEKPNPVGKYISNIVVNTLESTVVAENDNLKMMWDNEKSCVVVVDKKTGYIWSTMPNDYYNGIPAGMRADTLFNSPLIITYAVTPNNALKNINGANVEDDGFITVKQIENGVQVGYFFNNVEISVPLVYKLYDDHFTVGVDTRGILENKNKVYQIQIAPFVASVPASVEKDSYVYVPSGSGALMYTDERDGSERTYLEEVYGDDLSIFTDHITKKNYNAALPVFGVCRGENSIFAIIEEGASSCSIKASAGDNTVGYSNACAVFSVRGRNTEVVEMAKGNAQRVNNYSEGIVNGNCTVAFYPLSGEESSYSGMANLYREYLKEKYAIKAAAADSPLYLQILGGAMIDKSFVGIPYQTLSSATTLEQAEKIISEISKNTGIKPVVQLKGFGKTGLDIGQIGGGFKINGELGDWDDVKAIQKLTETYFDFDIVRFSSSGAGFSTISNSAKAENGGTAYQYYYNVATDAQDKDKDRYNLLSRNQLEKAFDKAVSTINKNGVNGISLSTLSNLAYSDYQSPQYYSKGNLDRDILNMLSKSGNKLNLLTANANAPAAVYSSHIISTPSYYSGFVSLDASVPFYRMVFKGLIPISSESVNIASNPKEELLKAVETGCGLLYTVSNNFNTSFRLNDSVLAKSVYSDCKDTILSDCKEISDLLSKVSGVSIAKHTILSNGVNQTEFENGITVIVNYTDASVETPFGVVEAESFVYK